MNFDPQTETDKIVAFINKTFADAHKSTAVVGLSGGIDSALSFTLTVKALGADHVHAYFLPAKSTPPHNLTEIRQFAPDVCVIPIGSIIQKSWRIIQKNTACRRESFLTQGAEGSRVEKKTHVERDQIRLANLTARIRMQILFDQAKKIDALVVGTENKSETLLGYFTRFGDAASDLEPLAHLFKTQVIELAKYLHLPAAIIAKPPSADLWQHQTDQAELGFSYADADPILNQISRGLPVKGELADRILARVNANQFKQQVPYRLDK